MKKFRLLSCNYTKLSVSTKLLLALLFVSTLPVQAVTLPTLGENSAYNLVETDSSNPNAIKLYDIKKEIKTFTYTDENGNIQTKDYEVKSSVDKYYDLDYKIETPTNNKNEYSSYQTVTDHFVGNTGTIDRSGGAISNRGGNIKTIVGDFIKNGYSGDYYGGAIYNTKTIGTITGDFIDNNIGDSGGAIYNGSGVIETINSNFVGNTSHKTGGALENHWGTITTINGNFINNSTQSSYKDNAGGAVYNYDFSTISTINANFINNKSQLGGAIYNMGDIGIINGDFIGNTVSSFDEAYSSIGGAINNRGIISSINGDFINNSSDEGGAIYNDGIIESLTGNFIGNTSKNGGTGGAIYNQGILSIVNSSFIGNNAEFFGGAIMSDSEIGLNITAENGYQSIFTDNKALSAFGLEDNQAIFNFGGALNINAKTGGSFLINDKIAGAGFSYYDEELDEEIKNDFIINFQGDNTGKIILNNNIESYLLFDESGELTLDKGGFAYINLHDVTLHLGQRDNVLDGNNLTLHSGTLNMVNGQIGLSTLNNLTLAGNTNLIADVDLANEVMDRITAKEYGKHNGILNVSGMHLLSDSIKEETEILFADEGLKDNVSTSVTTLEGYSPIYKYNVNYENRDDGGYFVFARGGNGKNSSDSFNPAVLSAPVSNVAAAQATVNETFKYVFEHADAFTQMPLSERISKINANKHALSTDFNRNLETLNYQEDNAAMWMRPYTTFESMNLKNGPKVDAITYGSLVGFDTNFFEYKNGWYGVGSGYVGYNGSQLSYGNVDTTMNGGLLGYTHTMYKGNLWTALTATAGASVGESTTMYGKEDFTNLMAGIGSKTGYNFEFKEGKYILQPIMFLSYTFVNTFDYTNAAGVKIKPSPAHSIQLNPSIRFITNCKNGWQPYASVGMVWNVMNDNKVIANNVRLPEMSIKPYVEYGLGVQRSWKDKFIAFGQAMIRNGGRNGVALTFGFRWNIGKDSKPVERVQKQINQKVSVLK